MGLGKKKILSQGASGSEPNSPLDIALWTGNATDNRQITVTNNPDFVIVKRRSYLSSWLWTYEDSSTIYYLSSNNDFPGSSYSGGVKAFNDGSFTLGPGGLANDSGQTCVGYSFQGGGAYVSNSNGSITSSTNTNVGGGFSIVKYVGNNIAGATIGHGLSQAPEFIIVKNLDTFDIWTCYQSDLGYTKYIDLSSLNAATTNSAVWYAAPTSTTFSFGANPRGNGSSNNIIALCFHSVDGYQKVGTYTGTGSSGNSVTTGFRPRFVMVKKSSGIGNWVIKDSQRDSTNPNSANLYPNLNNAENTVTTLDMDLDNNGFTLDGTSGDVNGSGQTYIYLAIA